MYGLVEQSGRTKATRYFVPPAILREAGLDALTTLTRVQPHRLRALILEDLERFPDSAKGDILRRVGPEIPERTFRRALEELVESGEIVATGEKRWRRYRLKDSIGHEGSDGR
jgi:ATP-dependent DNA helicase RecG